MKRELPAYCYLRHGRYVYFERRGQKAKRITAEVGTPEFWAQYAVLMKGGPPPATRRDFNALVRSYRLSDRFSRLAPRTRADYDNVLEWIERKLGKLPVAGLERRHVIEARDVNAATVRFANYIIQVLSVVMEHAIDLGWRDAGTNPARGVSTLSSGRAQRQPWPQDLIQAFRAAAGPRALLIFELCLGTGQRIGDVLKMRWDDIDADGINVTQGKTGAALWVPFTPSLRAVLAATPRVGMTICAHGKFGRPTSYRMAADIVMEVRTKIGAEAYDLHSLRYTAAAELAALGCSDELIASVTGHRTLAMVRKYAGAVRQKTRATDAQSRRK